MRQPQPHPISCVASTMRSRSRDAFASHPTPTPPHQLRSIDHAVKIKMRQPQPHPISCVASTMRSRSRDAFASHPIRLRSIDHAVKIKRCICIPPHPNPTPAQQRVNATVAKGRKMSKNGVGYAPASINMEQKMEVLVQMIFPYQKMVIFRVLPFLP